MIWLRSMRFSHFAVQALLVLLTAFHLALLGERVANGSVLDPAIAGEWLLGLLLVLGLVRLHRAGLSLITGRPALVLWLLVVVLHAVAIAPGDIGAAEIEVDHKLLAIVPLGFAIGVVTSKLDALQGFGAAGVWIASPCARLDLIPRTIYSQPELLSPGVPRAPPLRLWIDT